LRHKTNPTGTLTSYDFSRTTPRKIGACGAADFLGPARMHEHGTTKKDNRYFFREFLKLCDGN
jgi:hypothetical protein